jgi:hypothetical protein
MKKFVMRSEAEALASAWVSGQIAPEDFDDRIKEWQSEEAVLEAVRTGDLHRKQVQDEIERRKNSGQFDKETEAFVDKFIN